jgi:hypothetical protein
MFPCLQSAMPLRARFTSALFSFLAVLSATLFPGTAPAQAYAAHPKLIVIVVIDQFRGDYLNRDRAKFTGRGFRLFTEEGAWFTDCYYDYANTKTAPGHATIGTGAYTDGHGIESNEFWDASRTDDTHPNGRKVTAVEDERYQLVDLPPTSIPANQPGAPATALKYLIGSSPRNLRATTLGDELRLATNGRSRVYGISLKDRAAILPAGQAANGAFWIDNSSGHFTTSTYYMEHLPEWAQAFNNGGRPAQAAREALVEGTTQFFELVGHMPAANSYELDFAKALINGEKLGQSDATDLLVVSLSANDIQGHQFGPDSQFQEQMILGLDHDLDNFFTWIDKNVGLGNVWLALSADHGIPPIPFDDTKLGIHAATIDLPVLYSRLNDDLNARFSKEQSLQYLMPAAELPYIILDSQTFLKNGIDEKTAEDALVQLLPAAIAAQEPKIDTPLPAQHRLPPSLHFAGAYTRLELAHGELPPTEWGRLLAHSYANHGYWYVLLTLGAYQMENFHGSGGTTHFSPWSYDRHVPLAFYGAPFLPGEYHERVAPVDLAATLASLAGINQPSASVGRILTEAIKPIPRTGVK